MYFIHILTLCTFPHYILPLLIEETTSTKYYVKPTFTDQLCCFYLCGYSCGTGNRCLTYFNPNPDPDPYPNPDPLLNLILTLSLIRYLGFGVFVDIDHTEDLKKELSENPSFAKMER